MKQEVNPKETPRAQAYELWMESPMPMVTMVKTFDVTRLCKVSKRKGLKFNMLLCWCIGKAASKMEEFYLLPERGRDGEKKGRMFKYDHLAINVIVDNVQGDISNCDIPFSEDLEQFAHDYETLTKESATTCRNITDEDAMIVGTSTIVGTDLDCIVNQYSGIYNNPFLVWGRFKRHWLRTMLTISFQFDHVQMDGRQAARFLEELQRTMKETDCQTDN